MLKKILIILFLLCVLLLEACRAPMQKPHALSTPNYVAAHRGYSVAAPENTMPAFQAAYRVGAEAIEFDMQVTQDSHVIIIHDYTVNRTTNGVGKITDLTLSQIKKLDAGYKFSPMFRGTNIPTLREVLDFVQQHPPLAMFSEIKHYRTPTDIRLMVEPILQRGLAQRTVVTAFSPTNLQTVRQMSPHIGIGYLCPSNGSALHAYQLAHSDPNAWVMVAANVLVTQPKLILQAAKQHIRLVAWTVDREDLLDDLELLGVHRFVSDNPTIIEDKS